MESSPQPGRYNRNRTKLTERFLIQRGIESYEASKERIYDTPLPLTVEIPYVVSIAENVTLTRMQRLRINPQERLQVAEEQEAEIIDLEDFRITGIFMNKVTNGGKDKMSARNNVRASINRTARTYAQRGIDAYEDERAMYGEIDAYVPIAEEHAQQYGALGAQDQTNLSSNALEDIANLQIADEDTGTVVARAVKGSKDQN